MGGTDSQKSPREIPSIFSTGHVFESNAVNRTPAFSLLYGQDEQELHISLASKKSTAGL